VGFGDLSITVLLDMGPAFAGLETATAAGIQGLIDSPGSGTCSVSLRRLGIDDAPRPVSKVTAHDLRVCGGPGRWACWWQGVMTGPQCMTVLAIHELCRLGFTPTPKNIKMVPLVLAVGTPPDLVSKMTRVPESHVLHVPPHVVRAGWQIVGKSVERIRVLADPQRSMSKAAFHIEDRKRLIPPDAADVTYTRYAGFDREYRLQQQRAVNAIHTR